MGLGIATGYLVSKNRVIKHQIDNAVAGYEGSAEPATDGVTSAQADEPREVWRLQGEPARSRARRGPRSAERGREGRGRLQWFGAVDSGDTATARRPRGLDKRSLCVSRCFCTFLS